VIRRTSRVVVVACIGLAGAAESTANTKIPLCAGLTVAGAVSEPRGDFEPIVTVQSVSPQSIALAFSSQLPIAGGAFRLINVRRTVLLDDLRSATLWLRWFSPSAPITIPGSTALGVSSALFRALKTKGAAEVSLVDQSNSTLKADLNVHPNIYDSAVKYTLRRVPMLNATVPLTVNGARVDLPTIQAAAEQLGDKLNFTFLDDEDNPLALRSWLSTRGGGETIAQLVKISFRCDPSASVRNVSAPLSRLEQSLLTTGRADVYDIYFGFNSADIRPESEPTLREIAELLGRHADWKLGIEGHTDNIANDAYNLDLSRRRAGAVSRALSARYKIDAARLTADGFGESRPKDRNDTLEGRARNRRVELVRR